MPMNETALSRSIRLINNWLDNLTSEEQEEVDTFLEEHDPQGLKVGVWYKWNGKEWVECKDGWSSKSKGKMIWLNR